MKSGEASSALGDTLGNDRVGEGVMRERVGLGVGVVVRVGEALGLGLPVALSLGVGVGEGVVDCVGDGAGTGSSTFAHTAVAPEWPTMTVHTRVVTAAITDSNAMNRANPLGPRGVVVEGASTCVASAETGVLAVDLLNGRSPLRATGSQIKVSKKSTAATMGSHVPRFA